MAKRKRTAADLATVAPVKTEIIPPMPVRQSNSRRGIKTAAINANPDTNPAVTDGRDALRASPDAAGEAHAPVPSKKQAKSKTSNSRSLKKTELKVSEPLSSLSELSEEELKNVVVSAADISTTKKATSVKHIQETANHDPEAADGDEEAEPEELKAALARPPAVNSSYLPLPWKGRLGYACLNTYLRAATPPVFSSRTCRIASILEHRHPLKDPSQPEHATKNRPDKSQPADPARGQAWVEALGVANARDIPKMLRWNEKYGIKFMRLSSEMFPFASHDVYGYKLTPFASEALAEAGLVAAELGHRLTTHPGQFTQLGSPRPEVISASLRDLDYHCELLDLLKLPPQQDRDAVMILHMGGIFGDKQATIQRFKETYQKLPPKVKDRLVLENDDMCYSVHDILPVCEELNIPMVLDYHHNNIVFDDAQMREGTLDVMSLYDRIKATWDRKSITQKMHYSEPCPGAITARQRRKHNPRVYSMPPCAPDMDLMIEAKDKEQAVFEIMRNLKLPGFERVNDLIPYTRTDENRPWKPQKKKTPKKRKEDPDDVQDDESQPQPPPIIPEDEVGMGGPENRVYWPPGMEEWLRPKKREVKARDPEKLKTTAEKAAQRRAEKAAWQAAREASAEAANTEVSMDVEGTASTAASEVGNKPVLDLEGTKSVYDKSKISKAKPVRAPPKEKSTKVAKQVVSTPSTSDDEKDEDVKVPDLTDGAAISGELGRPRVLQTVRRQSRRGTKRKAVNYAED